MDDTAQIGLIGLAVMGANLARNIADKGYRTVVYNRTTEKMTDFIEAHGNDHLVGEAELENFVQRIARPRKIILMVKAGAAVDAVIEQLLPLLDKEDTIVDCGNSNYGDTIRRAQELSKKGLHFVGCGVSGGEEGALKGPSLMPGGSDESWKQLKQIWEAIAARDFDGGPCVTHVGTDGAGHYVKMVHNGIEYGVMQMIAEAYDLLKRLYGLDPDAIADIFEGYNQGRLQSYLFEIAVPVLRKKDDQTEGYLIDHILDRAGQKGTGRWTAIDALNRGVGLSTISEAVFARINSSHKQRRTELASAFPKPDTKPEQDLDSFCQELEQALYAGMLSSYAQGFELIQAAAGEQDWNINYAEIARIWQGGCIIRAQLLKFLTDVYTASEKESPHLLELPEIQESMNDAADAWRSIVCTGIQAGIPLPSLAAGLQYVDSSSTEVLPANMIQGLRDYFGAHTYERTDQDGSFHTEW